MDAEGTRREGLTPEEKKARRRLVIRLGRDGHMVAFETRAGKVFGNNAARLARQLLYWEGKGKDPSGFIYKTSDELENETNLSYGQQKRARQKLKNLEVLEERRLGWRGGEGNKLWFRLNLERLLKLVGPYVEEPDDEDGKNVISAREVQELDIAVQGTAMGGAPAQDPPQTPREENSTEGSVGFSGRPEKRSLSPDEWERLKTGVQAAKHVRSEGLDYLLEMYSKRFRLSREQTDFLVKARREAMRREGVEFEGKEV